MKTSNMYLNRLLKLSDALLALEENSPGKIYIANEAGTIEHFQWALDLIPTYKINPDGRKYEVLYGLANYFRLTADEVFHLFAVDCQDECYGGASLNSLSGPAELSQNIIALVNIKESESDVPVIELYQNRREKKNKVLTFKKYADEEKIYAKQYH
jgi:hypothetical protein